MYLRTESRTGTAVAQSYARVRPPIVSARAGAAQPATLEIALFGEASLHYGGRPRNLTAPPRTLALMAYLLLNRNVPLEREAIAAALWPDESDAGARANLRRHLFRLQHALPPAPAETPWLVVEGRTIRWNLAAPYRLDVERFERFAAEPADRELAIDLYRCDLLERVCEDWADRERERLRTTLTATLDALVAERLRSGDKPAAARFARTLARVEPFREDAIRLSMSLRAELGDRAGALAEYTGFAARLRSELAVEPDRETTALFETLRADRASAPVLSPRALALVLETRAGRFSLQELCEKPGGVLDGEVASAIDELLALAGAYVRTPATLG